MKRILVTGANGQLGSEIRFISGQSEIFTFYFTDIDSLDITDIQAVDKYMKEVRPDFVVNCAAYTAVDKAEQDKEAAWLLNAVAPGILAESCRRFSVKLIHISTDYVFDGTNHRPYTEDDPVRPLGNYGITKLEGERRCQSLTDPVIIRTSWLYSSFGNNFVKTMIRLARDRDKLGVVFDQVGTPTYARDLARAIIKILHFSVSEPDSWKPGIYHYSSEGVCSWYDFAIAIHRFAGIHCVVVPVETGDFPTLAKRPHYSVLNKSKIKFTFNIVIPYWMESLQECIQIIKNE
jgi:dTDP-4-dehydrorhamnose reductase